MKGAIDYARQGVCVMPVQLESGKWKQEPHQKYPVKPYEGLWTEERIREDWKPEWQVAIFPLPTPKWPVSVIDLDRDRANGTWEQGVRQIIDPDSSTYVNNLGGLCERNLWVRSPSGGIHIYVKRDDRLKACNNLGRRKGIDIRNDHRFFIVAPPSARPDGEYLWFGKYPYIDFDNPRFQPKEDRDLVEALLFLQAEHPDLPGMHQGGHTQKQFTREQMINANYKKRGEKRRLPTEKQKENSLRNQKKTQRRSEREKNVLKAHIEEEIVYHNSHDEPVSVIDRMNWRTYNSTQHELQKTLKDIKNRYGCAGRCSGHATEQN
jgi:hypothetical protein